MGRWPPPVRAATCPVNSNRTLEDKIRPLEQPQRLGLLLFSPARGGRGLRGRLPTPGPTPGPGERVSREPGTWVRPPTWLLPVR